ncbi:MAG: T9SS type A sorting domain-containing protein [Flavobacteriales bacterium]|nr:T9SS type A sorting domain-containing protein [Flavobacteriales bacterium]
MKKILLFLLFPVHLFSQSSNALLDSLVLYLPFDNGGSLADASGNGYNTSNSGASVVSGVFGDAYEFNGQSDQMTVTNAQTINNFAHYTISAWIKPSGLNAHNSIMAKVSPNRDFVLKLLGDGRPQFHYADGGTYLTSTDNTPAPLNQWTLVTGTYDGDSLKLYVNGVLEHKKFASFPPLWTSQDMAIGALTNTGGEHFMGAIDELRIYNRAFTEAEVPLLLNPFNVTSYHDTICFGDTLWFGSNYHTTSGTYSQLFLDTSSSGQDSLVVHYLYVKPQILIQSTHHMCTGDSVSFAGNTYTIAGTYVDSAISVDGCDSLNVLNVMTYGPIVTSTSLSICDGDSVMFGGQILTTSGTYLDSLQNFVGCDSTAELVLTVDPLPQVTLAESNDSLITTPGYAAYIWYLDGIQISGAGGPYHIPTLDGNYSVEVVDAFSSCLGISNVVNISGLIGIEEQLLFEKSFKIFPNPSKSEFTISGDKFIQSLEIYDLAGNRIVSRFVNSNVVNMNYDLAAGTYIVKISTSYQSGFLRLLAK